MQSVGGVIRLFPNWPLDTNASFRDLRAVGAFLVCAQCENGRVGPVKIFSEAGADLVILNPWPGPVRIVRDQKAAVILEGSRLFLSTSQNETIHLLEA